MADVPNVVKDSRYGYHRLDPIPQNEELAEFYRRKYGELAGQGARPQLASLPPLSSEEWFADEDWIAKTVHEEIADALKRIFKLTGAENCAPKNILEVGCGRGTLLEYLKKNGFAVEGIEPSEIFPKEARERGITVHAGMFGQVVEKEGWLEKSTEKKFDAVIFSNVLEHVMDPEATLELAGKLLAKGGLLVVRVPNDFSEMQAAALAAMNAHPPTPSPREGELIKGAAPLKPAPASSSTAPAVVVGGIRGDPAFAQAHSTSSGSASFGGPSAPSLRGMGPQAPDNFPRPEGGGQGVGENPVTPWWLCPPDHVSYFNFESLQKLLEAKGFEIKHRSADFPMEMFLLMGENYIDDPAVGRRVHQRRRKFDMALPTELRRKFYQALADAGVGRNILVVAGKRD